MINQAEVGQDFDVDDKPNVFTFNISDHVKPYKTPPGEQSIDPINYFVTSGDAVMKTKQLIKDFKKLISNTTNTNYKNVLKTRLKQSEKLLSLMIEIRGNDVFLETEWNDRILYCIPKNPRTKI